MKQLLRAAFISSVLAPCALGQTLRFFESAVASSTAAKGKFSAQLATQKGSGYWSSAGGHAPGSIVTWTGSLGARQKAVGVKLNWAYAPGEFKILTSGGSGNFEDASAWQAPGRGEVSYETVVMFDAPRSVQALTVAMRSPMPWGYFGLNDVALLVEPGPTLVVSGSSSPEGEVCLVSTISGIETQGCLEAIAAGDGREVFLLNAESQLESVVDGRCVALANGGQLVLEDCTTLDDANDGRGNFEFSATGQLRFSHLKDYCVVLTPSGASVKDCDSAGAVFPAAAPEWDATAVVFAKDLASMLMAATSRQRALLAKLQAALPALETCSLSFVNKLTTSSLSLAGAAAGRALMQSADPASQAIAMIDRSLLVDMYAVRSLIKESASTLTDAAKVR